MSWTHLAAKGTFGHCDSSVLSTCTHLGGYRLGSDCEWCSWQHALALLRPVAKKRAQGSGCDAGHKPPDNVLAKMPWLADIYGEAPARRGPGSVPAPDNDRTSPAVEQHDEDIDAIVVRDALAVARQAREVEVAKVAEREHFACLVRGGLWTASNKGVAFGSPRAQAITDVGKSFFAATSIPQSAT